MALTRDFKETVRARAQRDSTRRLALIEEAIESLSSTTVFHSEKKSANQSRRVFS